MYFSSLDPEVDAAATMLTLKNGPNATIQSKLQKYPLLIQLLFYNKVKELYFLCIVFPPSQIVWFLLLLFISLSCFY